MFQQQNTTRQASKRTYRHQQRPFITCTITQDNSNDLSSPTRSHKTTATTTDEASAGLSDQDTHCDRRINFRRSKICHRNYEYIYTADTNCDVIPRTSVLVCRRLLRLSTAFQIDLDITEIEFRQTTRVTFVTAVVLDYVIQLCKTWWLFIFEARNFDEWTFSIPSF